MTTRRPRTALPLVAAVLFAATASSHAAELVSFDMSIIVGADTDKAVAASFVADGITTTHLLKNNLLDGSGASPNTYPYSGNIATTWATISAQPSLDVATTLENANYFYFTITPLPGQSITLESLTFDAAASGTNLRSFYVLSSVTGFDVDHVLLSDNTDATLPRRAGGSLRSYTVTLTDPAFANITTPVTFRFYLQTPLINQELDFDNITLHGTASIPEPSAFAALAAAGSLVVAGPRRRRR